MLDNINTDKIREVMAGLEDLAVIRGDENPVLDMVNGLHEGKEDVVDKKLKGETPVCFGCWLDFLLADDTDFAFNFRVGSRDFAEYIGIKPYPRDDIFINAATKLSGLLTEYPELWGNKKGYDWNYYVRAYKPDDKSGRIRLRTVTNHWRKVADRLDAERGVKC